MTHPLQLILVLAIVVSSAKLAGALANRFGQPSVFGEILAGLILGPTVLDILGWPMFRPGGHGEAGPGLLTVVKDLADLGVLLLMFVAGLETDLPGMRQVGRVAFWAALGGVLVPLGTGAITAVAFGIPLYWNAIFVGTILTATSVSISAQTLLEIGALRSREGSTILGAAVIDDVMGIVLLSLVVALAKTTSRGLDVVELGIVGVRLAGYFALAVISGRLVGPALQLAASLRVSQGVLAGALVLCCVYAWAAEYIGAVAPITGAYIAGVLIAQTNYKHDVDAGIHPLTYSMFVPVFFISIGLLANGRDLGSHTLFTLVLVVVAIVGKVVGSGFAARVCGFTGQESVRVGVGMISRGEVGLIVAGYGLANGIIDQQVFSASVIVVLATTMVTPPLLRLVFPRHAHVGAVIEETVVGPPDSIRTS